MNMKKNAIARALSLPPFLLLSVFNAHHAWAQQDCSSNPITTAITGTCALSAGTTTISTTGSVSVPVNIAITNNVTGVSLVNNGSVSAGGWYGIYNSTGATIDTLTNSGTISAGANGGVFNNTGATIGTLTNSGTLNSYYYGLNNAGTITTLTNSGTISGGETALWNGGTIATLTNSGTISAVTNGIFNSSNGTIGTLANNGTVTVLYNGGSITSLNNAQGATIDSLGNSGSIPGGLNNAGTITTLTNNNTISASGSYGLNNAGTITTLTNNNTISGGSGGINNTGTISTITNGTITNKGMIGSINNLGNITTLNNAQGNLSSPLQFSGNLPTYYNVIIRSQTQYVPSPTNYGQISLNPWYTRGTTKFGIDPSSTLVAGTYQAVVQNTDSVNYGFSSSYTNQPFGQFIWSLVPSYDGMGYPVMDLVVTKPMIGLTLSPLVPHITTGTTAGLSDVGVTVNPLLAGGTLVLNNGESSGTAIGVSSAGGTIQHPTSGSATLEGELSGSGGLTFTGTGKTVLAGANTHSGGTTVSSGTLAVAGPSPTGTGDVVVSAPATLMGTGTIAGNVLVAGKLKPGHSPGYLSVGSNVTLNSGSVYQQDIAGKAQASSATPAGSTGYYSFLNVGGQYIINPGATLTPRLQNLFQTTESGYGSAPYVPVVGDKFRILTTAGGITGKFTTLTQPAGMAPATQFISFYNYNNSNSLDLAVIPASFNTAVASSGNKNAQSVGSALDKMVVTNQSSTATTAQDALLYTASGQSLASLPSFTQGMAGEIYGATLAVVPQTSQRIQQAVISRLGDTMTAPMMAGTMAAGTNTAISATNPGGQPTASMSSNPNVNPYASGSGGVSMSNGAAWGEIAYQYGNRSSDSNSGGWTSNLVQAVVGVDMYSDAGTKAGGGVALSNTNVSASQGSGTVQQGSLFLYGKLPVQQFVVDAMASYGFNSTDNTRNDVTGLTSGFKAKNVQGNDALVSLGLNLPIDLDNSRVTPYIRATWQQVNQNGFNEGTAASALTIKSFNNNGVRGVIGVAAGSKAVDPIKEQTTYRVNVGLGVDSTNVLNPQLSASLAGMTTTINTPSAGAAFVQAGMYGTVKFADNAFAYAGVTAEARSGQVLAGGNIGVRIQF